MAETDSGGDVFLASLELGGSTLPISVHASIDGAKRAGEDDAGGPLEWEPQPERTGFEGIGRIAGDVPLSSRWYSVARFMVHP